MSERSGHIHHLTFAQTTAMEYRQVVEHIHWSWLTLKSLVAQLKAPSSACHELP